MENTNMHTPMCYNHYSLSFIINTNNTSALNAHLRYSSAVCNNTVMKTTPPPVIYTYGCTVMMSHIKSLRREWVGV